jgi:hypothetical protein
MNLRAMLINCNVDNGGTNTNDLFSWHDQPIFLYSQHCVIFLLALFAGISTPLVLVLVHAAAQQHVERHLVADAWEAHVASTVIDLLCELGRIFVTRPTTR